MADMLLPAEPGTKALKLHWEGDTPWANMHPVIGWAYVSGGMAHPITAANITDAHAVLFPSGEVTDRRLRMSFTSLDSWLDEMQSLGPGREVAPHRSGGGEPAYEVVGPAKSQTEDPTPEDRGMQITELGLSSRARNALEKFGVHYVRDFGDYQRADIVDLRGVPANAMPLIEGAMHSEGVRWHDGDRPSETTAPSDDDNDDLL